MSGQAVAEVFDESLRQYMLKVYNYLTMGVALSGVVALAVANIPPLTALFIGTPLFWLCLFGPLIMLVFFSGPITSGTPKQAQMWFWSFCALEGVGLSVFFLVYTAQSMIQVFFITAAMFGAMSLFGYTTKKDLGPWASFLFMGLIGIIVALILNLFIGSSLMMSVISVCAVIVFAGLTAYDTQRIKNDFIAQGEIGNSAIQGALNLFLDFVNMFIYLAHLFGILQD